MRPGDAEKIFSDYLMLHRLPFLRAFRMDKGIVDFVIDAAESRILCNVKEVRDSTPGGKPLGEAEVQIRNGIKELEAKVANARPRNPTVFVTMNFSSDFFTALTVAKALFDEVAAPCVQDENKAATSSAAPHLPGNNAASAISHTHHLSGVLVFDYAQANHCLFPNPCAHHPVSESFFPGARIIVLDRNPGPDTIKALSKIIFFRL
ncbi:MAG: hypothetical protein JXD19_09380 [Deltaproteobacteria bacterium]|nr:hypothetical protein [Deltaproteobacteria bacterium]